MRKARGWDRGRKMVVMGHHLGELAGRKAPISFAKEAADCRKITKKS